MGWWCDAVAVTAVRIADGPTALAALGAMVRIGSGWTSVVNRSFLDGPARPRTAISDPQAWASQPGPVVVGWADVPHLSAVVRWLGCSYQDARLLRRQSGGINRFVPVSQLTFG